MAKPSFADYVNIISNLVDNFMKHHLDFASIELRCLYSYKQLLVFFMLMQCRHIYEFKAQRRWLETHPQESGALGFSELPHRTTLSRRYKQAYPFLCKLVSFVGEEAQQYGLNLSCDSLFADKSLFKAAGPVWHQSDRKASRIPKKLRHLDTDATWDKSGYHGWVYGYGVHLICNESSFPLSIQVETAKVSEKQILDEHEDDILKRFQPTFFVGDNRYFNAMRMRRWFKDGVILLTPAFKWVNGRYADAYQTFFRSPEIQKRYSLRSTTIEPVFDLIAKIVKASGRQKQLHVQRIENVRTCLTLAVFTLQIMFLANDIWQMPLRNISQMKSIFT